jgi:hypothetical protein
LNRRQALQHAHCGVLCATIRRSGDADLGFDNPERGNPTSVMKSDYPSSIGSGDICQKQ